MEELGTIERQLTAAAELHLSGSLPEALYLATVRGALATLPMPVDGRATAETARSVRCV